MLHEVMFRCGHVKTMALTGQVEDRLHKLEWCATHALCPDCRAQSEPVPATPPLRQTTPARSLFL